MAQSTSEAAQYLTIVLKSALADGRLDELEPAVLQELTTELVRLYSAKVEQQEFEGLPVDPGVMPTDVVVFVSEAIRSVDLNLFDLAMWYRRADYAGH